MTRRRFAQVKRRRFFSSGETRRVWTALRRRLPDGSGEKLIIASAKRTLTIGEVIGGWRENESFRAFFIAALAVTDYPAFFWEMPPIVNRSTNATYQHVAIRSDGLARMQADPASFAAKFRASPEMHPIASFANLGGDALLVAPKPGGASQSSAHLAAFVRAAPPQDCHELFRTLARALGHAIRICDGRLWTSTSGLGVPWLHIRLDSVPKYYNYRPYAEG